MNRFFYISFSLFIFGVGSIFSHELPITDCPGTLLKLFKHPKNPYKRLRDKRPDPPFRGSIEEQRQLEAFLAEPLGSSEKESLSPTEKLLQLASQKLDSSTLNAFYRWLLAQYAEDPRVSFEDSLLGRQKSKFPEGPNRYNRSGERPFDGYLAARAKLSQLPIDKIDLSQIQEIHRVLMSRESIQEDNGRIFQTDKTPPRNSQNLKDSELGMIRNENIGFEVSGKTLPGGFSAIGKTVEKLEDLNPFIEKTRDGFISYAPLSDWRKIDIRHPLSDELIKRLVVLEKKYGETGLNQKGNPEIREALKDFLTELSDRVWSEAKEAVQRASSRKEVIDAVARFQHDFISIHPFLDGNGRTARLLSEKLLESRGLPSPTYAYWGEDVSLTPYEMGQSISMNLLHSDQLQKQLAQALQSGDSFEEVLNPALSARARELLGDPYVQIDGKAFLKFVDAHREQLTSFSDAVRSFWEHSESSHRQSKLEEFLLWKKQREFKGTTKEGLKEYAEWLKAQTYEDGSGAIRLAPPEFQRSFAKLSSSQEEYDKKMNQYYVPEKIFRGVPSDKYLSDQELVQLLSLPSIFTTGNGVPFQTAHESSLPVFQQYNAGLLGDSSFLRQQVIDHKNGTTDNYHMTGMVSFSEKRSVAEHWHQDPREPYGLIFTARKRTVGSINTAKYNPRLGQLGVENEFEEALIGGADPESIMAADLVQHYPDPIAKTPRRMKRASRVSYNRILVRETIFDEHDQPRVGSSTLWEIAPDGSIHLVPKE